MFSLIIVIISIALVAALALATLYFGGSAATRGNAKSVATQAITQSTQLLGAAELYYADKGEWPTDIPEMVSKGYLKSQPQLMATRGADGYAPSAYAAQTAMEWTMPVAKQPTFVLSGSVSTEVCQELNQLARGDNGILGKAYTTFKTQCFGEIGSLVTIVSKNPYQIKTVIPDEKVDEGPIPDPDGDGWTVKPGGKVQPSGGTGGPTPPAPLRAGVIGISQNPISLPNIEVNTLGATATSVTVTNLGNTAHTFELTYFMGPSMSAVVYPVCTSQMVTDSTLMLAPGETCTISVQYLQKVPGTYSVPLEVRADTGDALPVTYNYRATGNQIVGEDPQEAGGLALNYTRLTLPDTKVGSMILGPELVVTNRTSNSINFTSEFVDAVNSYSGGGLFLTPSSYDCLDADTSEVLPAIPANSSCTFTPRFLPDTIQAHTLSLTVANGLRVTIQGNSISRYVPAALQTINVPAGMAGYASWHNNNDSRLYLSGMFLVSQDGPNPGEQSRVDLPRACESVAANARCSIDVPFYLFTMNPATSQKLYFELNDGEVYFSGITFNEVEEAAQSGSLSRTSQHYEGGGIVTLTAPDGTFSPGVTPLIILDSENDSMTYAVSPLDIQYVDSRTIKFLVPPVSDSFSIASYPPAPGEAKLEVYYSGNGGATLMKSNDKIEYVVNPTLSLASPVSVVGTHNLTFTHPSLDSGTVVLREPFIGGGEWSGSRIGAPYNTSYANSSGSATFGFNYFDFNAQREICCTANQVNLYLRTGSGEVFPIQFGLSYPPFTVSSVTPNQAYVGTSGVKVTLYGSGFTALPGNNFSVIPFVRVGSEPACTSMAPYYTPVVVSDTEMYITIDQYGPQATGYCTGMQIVNHTSGVFVQKPNAFKYLGNANQNGAGIPGGSGGQLDVMLEGNTYNMPTMSNNTLGGLYTYFPNCGNDSCLALAFASYYQSAGYSGAFCTVVKNTTGSPYSETYLLNCRQ